MSFEIWTTLTLLGGKCQLKTLLGLKLHGSLKPQSCFKFISSDTSHHRVTHRNGKVLILADLISENFVCMERYMALEECDQAVLVRLC